MKLIIKRLFVVIAAAFVLIGCSNKINQTGAWLVSSDSTLVPTVFDSRADSAASTGSQVNVGLATGSSEDLILGKVPWTEADLLIRFSALDPVDSAQAILSATMTLSRSPYLLQPAGEDINNLTFAGYSMDSVWSTAFTWDSVQAEGYGTQNIVTGSSITDSTIDIQVDTGAVRQWAIATQDTNVKNNGMIIRPLTDGGVVSVYGPAYGTAGYVPTFKVIYIKSGTLDTSVISVSYATAVAKTSILNVAPAGPYQIVQAGTGERVNLVFDLSRVPKYSIVNQATLTLYSDTVAQVNYTRKYAADTLQAYYTTDVATGQFSTSFPATGIPIGNQYTFDVTILAQHMLNAQNDGFMIVSYNELNNVDLQFLYNQNAPDTLRPRLTITYTPTSRR